VTCHREKAPRRIKIQYSSLRDERGHFHPLHRKKGVPTSVGGKRRKREKEKKTLSRRVSPINAKKGEKFQAKKRETLRRTENVKYCSKRTSPFPARERSAARGEGSEKESTLFC